MRLYPLFLSIAVIVFSACSTKEVYEPDQVAGEWEKTEELEAAIVDKTSQIALFDNGEVAVGKDRYVFKLPQEYRIVGKSGSYLLATDIAGDLLLKNIDTDTTKTLHLEKTIAAASTDDDVVAVIFSNGDIALYRLQNGELLFKEDGATSIALDARIVNPYFMDDLVLFLTLDGKMVIVNKKLKKRLRTVIVSAQEYFNNIIYFTLLQERLIIASGTKLLSFGAQTKRAEYEAREIVHDKDTLYIATKQGDIVALSPSLDLVEKIHFPFAHFLGLQIVDGKLYALEKEGYLITLSKDLLTYKVYAVDFSEEGDVYRTPRSFIVADKAILLDSNASAK